MNDKSFSGASLEKALKEGALTQTQALLTGMVKPSDKSGYVGFSQSGCDMWVDLPTDMIEHADHIGLRACRDHMHPVMRVTLKESKDPEGRILWALLAHATPNPLAGMPVGGSFQGPQHQGGIPPQAFPGGVPTGNAPSQGVAATPMMTASMPSFGFGGFGFTVMPSCRWETRVEVCGSSLPGHPPILCERRLYCCTWPNGTTYCM
jgi:hypothetical protein